MKSKKSLFQRFISLSICFSLIFQQAGFAQAIGNLNLASYLGAISSQDRMRPVHLRYFSYDGGKDTFNLLVDKGDFKNIELKDQTKPLFDYFLIGISLPNESFWVNLRPDIEEGARGQGIKGSSVSEIIDDDLAKTDMGRILLESDVQLKKDTAAFTSPETSQGKEYWNRLYRKAEELFGTENVSIPTLTRPWIVPADVILRYTDNSAYVYKATLKVMLEEDYLKESRGQGAKGSSDYNFNDPRLKDLNKYAAELVRELIIPKLNREVNTAKRYAPLRQVYYSLILAQWFKQRFIEKGHKDTKLQSHQYVERIDSRNLSGLVSKESWSKTKYFNEYQKSFRQGEYNIKEQVYRQAGQSVRSYFSGGLQLGGIFNAGPGGTAGAATDVPALGSTLGVPERLPDALQENGVEGVTVGPEGVILSGTENPGADNSTEISYEEELLRISQWTKDDIARELDQDIHGPIMNDLNRIKEHLGSGEVNTGVRVRVSETDTARYAARLGRPARVAFLPMKGDPWQVGHLFVILEAIAKYKLDKVVIMVDNGDPRKPDLRSLTIREPLSKALLAMLGPLVQFTPIPKEHDELFSADGETVFFKILSHSCPLKFYQKAN